MDLGRWIDAEGRVPLFFAAGALVLVFGFLGVFATTGGPFREDRSRDIAADDAVPDRGAVEEVQLGPLGSDRGEELPPTDDGHEVADVPTEEAPTRTDALSTRRHEVASGETLYGIAQHFYGNGRHWRALAEANHLDEDGMVLRTGHSLVIPELPLRPAASGPATVTPDSPTDESRPARPSSSESYTVRAGDTWWSIAERSTGSGKNWTKLARANPGIEPEAPLPVGQSLVIPEQP